MATEVFYDDMTARASGGTGTAQQTSSSGLLYPLWNNVGIGGSPGAYWLEANFSSLTAPFSWGADLGSPDQIFTFVVTSFRDGADVTHVRMQAAADLSTYVGIAIQPGATKSWDFYKNGAQVQVGAGAALLAGDEVTLYIKGNRLEVWVNGFYRGSYQGGAALAGTYAGIYSQSTTGVTTPLRITRAMGYALKGSLPIVASTKAYRLGYDRDGTVVAGYQNEAGYPGVLTQTQREQLNNTKDTDAVVFQNSGQPHGVSFVFPEPRHIAAVMADIDWGLRPSYQAEWSVDSTDGSGGTWSTYANGSAGRPYYTTPVISTSSWGYRQPNFLPSGGLSSARAMRFYTGFGYQMLAYTIHLYGWIPAGAGVHRVQFWHPYLDVPLPSWYFDLDDVGSGSFRTRSFRLKNISLSLIANNVMADLESLDAGTAMTDQWGIRLPTTTAETYPPNITVPTLNPGEISPVITTRRITPSDQTSGVAETLRVRTSVGSFT